VAEGFAVEPGRVAVADLLGVDLVEDAERGRADAFGVAWTTSTGFLPGTLAAQVDTYGTV
jgi:hypothetical protein